MTEGSDSTRGWVSQSWIKFQRIWLPKVIGFTKINIWVFVMQWGIKIKTLCLVNFGWCYLFYLWVFKLNKVLKIFLKIYQDCKKMQVFLVYITRSMVAVIWESDIHLFKPENRQAVSVSVLILGMCVRTMFFYFHFSMMFLYWCA